MQTKRQLVLQVLIFVIMLRNPRLLFVIAASYNNQDHDVVMLLPEEREEAASMMTVVKPFDVGLWCTLAGSLIYAVSVAWLLEQRISTLSLTELLTRICSTSIRMSLSSFNIQNRLARIVISVWLLVLSVLAIGYTTNYILMLNGQKVNVNEIIARDGAIGYLKDNLSPCYQDQFENLKAYATEEECAQALSLGPNRGGVGVILMDRLDALDFISRRPGYTYYNIPPEADTPRSLGVLDFLLWFIITGTVSTVGLIKFIFDLLYSKMHRPSETLRHSDLHGRSPGTRTPEMVPQICSLARYREEKKTRNVRPPRVLHTSRLHRGNDDEKRGEIEGGYHSKKA